MVVSLISRLACFYLGEEKQAIDILNQEEERHGIQALMDIELMHIGALGNSVVWTKLKQNIENKMKEHSTAVESTSSSAKPKQVYRKNWVSIEKV